MTVQSETGLEDRIVVGYFPDGADALRAINELMDEGFRASDIGAAFRTRRAGEGPLEGASTEETTATGTQRTDDLTPAGERNPALTGSVGGAGSHDEAVTPAGLAPGSGNAFPAASRPGPIPGGEIPSTLPHDLPSTLAHDLPSDLSPAQPPETVATAGVVRAPNERGWGHHLRHVWGSDAPAETGGPRLANSSANNFGTGEGHLDLSSTYNYSEPSFESSFVGMGLGASEARGLSGELSQGGAVISVTPGGRAALAEGIIERNHGRLRFESATAAREAMREEDRRVEIFGRMQNYYRSDDDLRNRRAS